MQQDGASVQRIKNVMGYLDSLGTECWLLIMFSGPLGPLTLTFLYGKIVYLIIFHRLYNVPQVNGLKDKAKDH